MAPGATFLLEQGREARGLVAGVRDPQEEAAVHLMAMWIHPDLRGAGAAGALVRSVKAWAVEVGATEVRLNVVESTIVLDDAINGREFARPAGKVWSRKTVMSKSR